MTPPCLWSNTTFYEPGSDTRFHRYSRPFPPGRILHIQRPEPVGPSPVGRWAWQLCTLDDETILDGLCPVIESIEELQAFAVRTCEVRLVVFHEILVDPAKAAMKKALVELAKLTKDWPRMDMSVERTLEQHRIRGIITDALLSEVALTPSVAERRTEEPPADPLTRRVEALEKKVEEMSRVRSAQPGPYS